MKGKGLLILGTVIGIVSIVLTFVWYDWKLAIILGLALWSNNIQNYSG
jgi:hypothetical protein